ncbi:pentatricopeptide repeat-containing protein At2g13600-like [Humulus lupulus]|uniref:pentatricopeptide repeat-containing protein At2g13600-like n=1 Tax=Humulus lupulus TaxID=3486 RepID=UPI002B404F57|nr:pentatricopeptide repeat-containing protein At2g13600-like [Humulus lupulus]
MLTKYSLCSALNTCAKTLNQRLGLQIHALIIEMGYEDNIFLNSALIDLYAKCDAILEARRVFCSMKQHDQVSWTSIISGLSKNDHEREAIWKFKEMLSTQINPNSFTYVGVISACSKLEEGLQQGSLLHAHVIKLGFNDNNCVASSLIDCYSKWGEVDQAKFVFDEITEKDGVLLGSMISGYAQNLYGDEALKVFMEMRNMNLSPNDHTLTSVLNACGSLTVLQEGKQVHSLVTKMGSESNVFVASALIDMYSKCGSIDEARGIFDQTPEKNTVLWTSLIMGYAQSGRGSEALELFDHLVTEEGLKPDHICFTAILTACNHVGFLERGVDYFNKMIKDYGLVPELDQYACLVDLYARNGHLRKAKELMEEMPCSPNHVMWSSFLGFCKVYGEVELGREAAKELIEMEPFNAAPIVTLSHLYARAGLWTEVAEVRKLMQKKDIRKSSGWSRWLK